VSQSLGNSANVTESQSVPSLEKSTPKIDRNSKNLLDAVARKYQNKIVGELKNIKTAVCAVVSKDLPKENRFSLIILNPSSTGKSYFLNTILEPFRASNDVIDFTDFTEAYLKRSYQNVDGKIIKIEQLEKRNENGQLSFERLKHLLSEGVIRFGNVDQNENGKRDSKIFEVKGIPVILTTATDSNIDRETENRFLIMELDESEEQTKKIIDYTLNKYASLDTNDIWGNSSKELANFFKELKHASHMIECVKIPFAKKLFDMLPKNLEIRRDLTKILNLTCVIAFINYRNRDKLQKRNPEHLIVGSFGETEEIHKAVIIARPDDFHEALEIAGNTINRTINKSTTKTMELYARIKKMSNEKPIESQGVTINELTKSVGWGESTLRDHLKTLSDNGFVIHDVSTKEHKYFPLEKKFSELTNTEITYSDNEYQEWLKNTVNDSYIFVPARDEQDLEISRTNSDKTSHETKSEALEEP